MKVANLLVFCLFNFMGFQYLAAAQEKKSNAHVEVTFYTAKEIENRESLHYLNKIDPGYHKCIFKHHNFPLNSMIRMRIERPLIQSTTLKEYRRLARQISNQFTILPNGKLIGSNSQDEAIEWCVTSKGFLPGEQAEVIYLDIYDKVITKLSITPNPIQAKSAQGNVTMTAILDGLSPTHYTITIQGLRENEPIEFVSESGDEKLNKKINYKPIALGIYPGVVNKSKGWAHLKVVRQSGEFCKLSLPWGETIAEYIEKNYDPDQVVD